MMWQLALLSGTLRCVWSLAPVGTITEATGWLITAINLGLAGGTALAGWCGGAYLVSALAAAVAAAVALALSAAGESTGPQSALTVRVGEAVGQEADFTRG
ncbi:hypothetical protein [Streptomyces boninensis]|uniref:hypothetical protein n=1 Tax=Streptomyces boninensis TaxID=2039455 RepID=UPI003B21B086